MANDPTTNDDNEGGGALDVQDGGVIEFGDDEGEDFEPGGTPEDRAQDEGGIEDIDFGDDEGEDFEPGGTPEDRAQDLVDKIDPTDPMPEGPLGGDPVGPFDEGPTIVGPDDGRGGGGESAEEDAIRELLNTPELTNDERDKLEDEKRDAELRNSQDNIELRLDREGGGVDPEPVVPD